MATWPQKDDPPTRPWLPWIVALDDTSARRKGWRTVRNNMRWTNPSVAKSKHWSWKETRFESPSSERWQLIKRVKIMCTPDSKEEEIDDRPTVVCWGQNRYYDEGADGRDGGAGERCECVASETGNRDDDEAGEGDMETKD